MKTEMLVVTLDAMITHIDQALDELSEAPDLAARNAENMLMDVTIALNALIDRLTEEGYEPDSEIDDTPKMLPRGC